MRRPDTVSRPIGPATLCSPTWPQARVRTGTRHSPVAASMYADGACRPTNADCALSKRTT
jgi:hypothetical protein